MSQNTTTESAAYTTAKMVKIADQTHLRHGVATLGVDNIVGTLPGGQYPAIKQCAGELVTGSSSTVHNFWWVQVAALGTVGWVSAVLVLEGGNDLPIEGVPTVATVNG